LPDFKRQKEDKEFFDEEDAKVSSPKIDGTNSLSGMLNLRNDF